MFTVYVEFWYSNSPLLLWLYYIIGHMDYSIFLLLWFVNTRYTDLYLWNSHKIFPVTNRIKTTIVFQTPRKIPKICKWRILKTESFQLTVNRLLTLYPFFFPFQAPIKSSSLLSSSSWSSAYSFASVFFHKLYKAITIPLCTLSHTVLSEQFSNTIS